MLNGFRAPAFALGRESTQHLLGSLLTFFHSCTPKNWHPPELVTMTRHIIDLLYPMSLSLRLNSQIS